MKINNEIKFTEFIYTYTHLKTKHLKLLELLQLLELLELLTYLEIIELLEYLEYLEKIKIIRLSIEYKIVQSGEYKINMRIKYKHRQRLALPSLILTKYAHNCNSLGAQFIHNVDIVKSK